MDRPPVIPSAKRRTYVIDEPEAVAPPWASSLRPRLQQVFASDESGERILDLLSNSLSTTQTLKSYAGRLSQFAEFCHDSENISPLEGTTATVVRYVAWIAIMSSSGFRAGRTLLSRGIAAAASSAGRGGLGLAPPAIAASAGAPPTLASALLAGPQRGSSLLPLAARGMAGGSSGEAVTYAGLTLHKPAAWQKNTGTAMAAIMWFWVFVRLYHDWDLLIFGPEIHLKHDDHDEEHH
eukprot:jgi/Tetstr1/442122/TSEL_030277.t1